MEEFEEVVTGQVPEEDFMHRFGNKAVKKVKATVLGKQELDEEFEMPEEYADPEIATKPMKPQKMPMNEMQAHELAIQEQQYIEYQQKNEKNPQSQVELDNRLMTISARSSEKRELIKALKTPDGQIRDLAIHLEEEWPELFTEDMTKGNFSDQEVESVWGNGSLCNYLKAIGSARQADLRPAYRFFKHNMDLYTNMSRSKGGFSAILTKTDKHVSEGMVKHVQQSLEVKKKKTWGWF